MEFYLGDAGDHGGDRLLSVGVEDFERFAEIVENLGEKSASVRDDESDVESEIKFMFNLATLSIYRGF